MTCLWKLSLPPDVEEDAQLSDRGERAHHVPYSSSQKQGLWPLGPPSLAYN